MFFHRCISVNKDLRTDAHFDALNQIQSHNCQKIPTDLFLFTEMPFILNFAVYEKVKTICQIAKNCKTKVYSLKLKKSKFKQ